MKTRSKVGLLDESSAKKKGITTKGGETFLSLATTNDLLKRFLQGEKTKAFV